jgi:hypothetical protein
MESLVDELMTFGKKLPGFGMAFLVATVVYMYLKGDYTKLSSKETFVAALLAGSFIMLLRTSTSSTTHFTARRQDSVGYEDSGICKTPGTVPR